jgi:hypothetical protein
VGKLVHTLGLDSDILPPKEEKPKNAGRTVMPEITAAITAAVTEYQKKEDGRNE